MSCELLRSARFVSIRSVALPGRNICVSYWLTMKSNCHVDDHSMRQLGSPAKQVEYLAHQQIFYLVRALLDV